MIGAFGTRFRKTDTVAPRPLEYCSVNAIGTLNLEAARIAYKPLQTEEHDLAVQRRRHDLARLLIKIRRGEAGYALAKKFLDESQELPPETEI